MRSSLKVLVVLIAAACAPVDGSEGGATDSDAEEALTLSGSTAVVTSTSTLAGTVVSSSVSKVAAVRPKAPASCANYDAITAAIASRTIDCLGTIGPDSYGVDGKGSLAPRFDKCTEQTESSKEAYEDILALLSIQARKDFAAEAQRCIAGRWSTWQKEFYGLGIEKCPLFRKVETINAPTPELVKRYGASQPKLPVKETGDDPAMPHENYLVELKWAGEREQRCKDEADCARLCLAGLPGAYIEGTGTKALLDPTYWLISLNFGESNPFMQPGYYHPMSFYGTPPGALFGHRSRVGEACSRFVVDEHVYLTLQLDCLDYNKPTTCLSVCEESPIDTAGTGSDAQY